MSDEWLELLIRKWQARAGFLFRWRVQSSQKVFGSWFVVLAQAVIMDEFRARLNDKVT